MSPRPDLSTQPSYGDPGLVNGLIISRAGRGYEATSIKDAEPGHPRIPAGGAALSIERVTFGANDHLLGYEKRIYGSDRYRATAAIIFGQSIVCFEMP